MRALLIEEIIKKLDRKRAQISFGEHAAKDKNLNREDVDNVIQAIRVGKVDKTKSDTEKERVCFKDYFSERRITSFAVVEYYPEFIKVVTVIKKKGKY